MSCKTLRICHIKWWIFCQPPEGARFRWNLIGECQGQWEVLQAVPCLGRSVLESGFCRLSAVNDPGECLGLVRGSTDTVLSQGRGVNAQQSCHGSCPCLVVQQRHCEQEVSYSWAGGHDFSPVHSDSRPSVRSFFSSSDGPGVRILPVPSRLWPMVTIRMEFKNSHICIFLCW